MEKGWKFLHNQGLRYLERTGSKLAEIYNFNEFINSKRNDHMIKYCLWLLKRVMRNWFDKDWVRHVNFDVLRIHFDKFCFKQESLRHHAKFWNQFDRNQFDKNFVNRIEFDMFCSLHESVLQWYVRQNTFF